LFGYEKGAFTGAAQQQKGKIEAADGGTLFLDEVGELTMPMQAALLRVLQEREFYRVGGTKPVTVDVRLLAATNRDLEEQIKEERFREDLFFRLRVVVLEMPSILECRADIPLLASHFLQKLRYIRVTSGFSTDAQRILQTYHWQGNVRELQNAVQHALLFGDSTVIQPEDLPEYVLTSKSTENSKATSYQAQLTALKRALLKDALKNAKGNHAEAARSLDVSPSYFRRLARDLNITL
jgi:Nif-specific regulatory protein